MPLTAVPDPFGGDYRELRRITTTPCCGASSTPSASTTNSPAPPTITSPAASTTMLLRAARALRRDHGGDAADARRGAPGDLQPLPADLAQHRPRALRADEGGRTPRPAPSPSPTRTARDVTHRRSPAATPSCSGSRTSACAGPRSASTSRCSARTTRPTRRSTTGSARSSAPRRREHYVYELFLDDKGQKISKSKGNGLTIDEWLTYADPRVLVALHVPEAARGQEALLRRHPARGGRVLQLPLRLSAPGGEGPPDESRLAHP